MSRKPECNGHTIILKNHIIKYEDYIKIKSNLEVSIKLNINLGHTLQVYSYFRNKNKH